MARAGSKRGASGRDRLAGARGHAPASAFAWLSTSLLPILFWDRAELAVAILVAPFLDSLSLVGVGIGQLAGRLLRLMRQRSG
jgi:hypothetical protein